MQDSDHARAVEIWNASAPLQALSLEEFQRDLATLEAQYQVGHFVAAFAGEIVGYLELSRSPATYHPQRFYLELAVDPHARGQGVGRALYAHALEVLSPLNPRWLHAFVREDQAVALGMLERRGFLEVRRVWGSVLNLAHFDPSRFEAPETLLRRSGLTLHSFAELDSSAFRRAFYAFSSEVRLDIPRSAPPTPLGYEFWEAQVLEAPNYLPEAAFFALASHSSGTEGANITGYSNLARGVDPEQVETWLTLVRRSARGRGVALALKLAGLRWALEQGYKRVHTDNDATNAPMLRVNEKLGFVRQTGFVRLLKTFETGSSEIGSNETGSSVHS